MVKCGHCTEVPKVGIQKLQFGTYEQPFSGCVGLNISQPPVVQAGFGIAGTILVVGLAVGAIYSIMKKPR